MTDAPGHPGIDPRWTSSAKTGIGTALSALSRVWFTLSHGILNEVYYPRVDQACVRDFGFLVTDGETWFSEEKRDATSLVERVEDGVPAFRLTNTAPNYTILKRVVSDPRRDVVLQSVSLRATTPNKPLHLFPLLGPHLVNGGAHNTGWVGDYKGTPMLFAEGDGTALALGASVSWRARSAGFVGVSDGWQTVSRDLALTETWDRAADGNVALTGEIIPEGEAPVVLALGFGRTWSEAALRVRLSLADGFDAAEAEYRDAWRQWQSGLRPLDRAVNGHNSYRISTTALRAHDNPSFPGGIIASLSIPWGASKGDDDLGGYHLVWPRDLVETAGGLLACGAAADARRVLDYLRAIQVADGSWPQNVWLDGLPYWGGIQMDECAFPILLVDLCLRHGALTRADLPAYWPMVRAAASYVFTNGPITGQDRWEEDSGFSPFTLAVEIAALLVAADLAETAGEPALAPLLRDTADAWHARIDEWTYAAGTALAREAGVAGYYVRIAPPEGIRGRVNIKNRAGDASWAAACDIVSPDALALTRFGLRSANDPRMRDTVAVIDRLLRVELPAGSCWHRYNADGYGEHEDGSPFDGTGIGRAWPLLTGERALHALAAGDQAEAERLLVTMERLTSPGGLIPEQVWDADDIPARELFRGQPSGSAMPLVWAHAEHVKICRSLADGAVFDTPPQALARYVTDPVRPRVAVWRPSLPVALVAGVSALRIDLPSPATIRWTSDGWAGATDTETAPNNLGGHSAELPVSQEGRLTFTWRDADGSWSGRDETVVVTA